MLPKEQLGAINPETCPAQVHNPTQLQVLGSPAIKVEARLRTWQHSTWPQFTKHTHCEEFL